MFHSELDSFAPVAPLSAKNFKMAMDEVRKEHMKSAAPLAASFNPYSDEGGTCAGIAGENFVIIGADTRMSYDGFSILTRNCEKVFKLSDDIVLTSTGFYGDVLQLVRVLQVRHKVYKFTFNEDLSIDAAAEMLARTLYYKRFFPYYTGNILGGLNEKGQGVLYGYDPVGTIESLPYCTHGAGTRQIDPFFDNQIKGANLPQVPKLTKERAQQLMRDAFRSVAERETSTGDSLYMVTLEKDKPMVEERVKLRED